MGESAGESPRSGVGVKVVVKTGGKTRVLKMVLNGSCGNDRGGGKSGARGHEKAGNVILTAPGYYRGLNRLIYTLINTPLTSEPLSPRCVSGRP